MKNIFPNYLYVVLVFLCHVSMFVIHAADTSPYSPADKLLLNCGGPAEATDTDDRKWITDIGSKFAPVEDNTLTGTASTQDPSVPQIPFMTARVFRSEFTYSFPVASGRKFLRLYFYPASYAGLNASHAVFDVTCGEFTLLRNFSALQTVQALNYSFILKEFLVIVVDGKLNVTFKPYNDSNAYAFVNGIEVVSMPDIYITKSGEAMLIGDNQPYYIDNSSTSMENVYRLNVGGDNIPVSKDTGMYRSWTDDSRYIYGAATGVTSTTTLTIKYPNTISRYVAPQDVYATARTMGPYPQINQNYNLTWVFAVDSGFHYLVRLHFCEIQPIVTKVNQRKFQIFINNQTADLEADVITWAGGNGIPTFKDYVVFVPRGDGQQDLCLALHPNVQSKSEYYDAILNGLEIFKINDTTGNLAGPNPIPPPKQERINPSSAQRSSGSGNSKDLAGVIAGVVVGGFAAICLFFYVGILFSRRIGEVKDSNASDGPFGWPPLSLHGNSHSAGSKKTNTASSYASSLKSSLGRNFSLADIKVATNKFDDESPLL